jgi:hypothetical protein
LRISPTRRGDMKAKVVLVPLDGSALAETALDAAIGFRT